MLIPPMCEVKTFEQIKAEMVETYKGVMPFYEPNESDDVMPVLEAFAYRELMLRTFFNTQVANSFWQTATGKYLDFIAAFFDVFRLIGEKPTAYATFTINTVLGYDYVLESGLELLNNDGSMSVLIQNITIPTGSIEASGIIELQLESAQSSASVSSVMVPRPYLKSVIQTTTFSGGSDTETDDEMRDRIKLSFEEVTTAGSVSSYRAYALKADERIDDVAVLSPTPGVVDVIIHSLSIVDAAMISRAYTALSADTARPLCDTVQVRAATVTNYTVTAVLTLDPLSDPASTLGAARVRLNERVQSILIGQSITTSSIIAALSVDGVDDVTLIAPVSTVSVLSDGIAICTLINISVGA